MKRQPGWEKALGEIQNQDDGTCPKPSFAYGVGRGGMTGTGIAHVHPLEQTGNPNGKWERAAQVTEQAHPECIKQGGNRVHIRYFGEL